MKKKATLATVAAVLAAYKIKTATYHARRRS